MVDILQVFREYEPRKFLAYVFVVFLIFSSFANSVNLVVNISMIQ